MLSMLKRSLSDGSEHDEQIEKKPKEDNSDMMDELFEAENSSDSEESVDGSNRENIKDSGTKMKTIRVPVTVPDDTPLWGLHLLNVMQNDFKVISRQIKSVTEEQESVQVKVKEVTMKLGKLEMENAILRDSNLQLKEKLLDLKYRQRRNNLTFEGIPESEKKTDKDTMRKLRRVLKNIPDLDMDSLYFFERCHHLGAPSKRYDRKIICCFSYYQDVSAILKHRKLLPRGVYVNENLPDEWEDRRQILRPLLKAAKKDPKLKEKSFMT